MIGGYSCALRCISKETPHKRARRALYHLSIREEYEFYCEHVYDAFYFWDELNKVANCFPTALLTGDKYIF